MTSVKSIDHEVEGSHAQIGADLAKKFRENNAIIHAIMAHHGDVEPQNRRGDPCTGRRRDLRCPPRRAARDARKLYQASGKNSKRSPTRLKVWIRPSPFRRVAKFASSSNPIASTTAITVILAKEIAKRIEGELEYPWPDQGQRHSRKRVRSTTQSKKNTYKSGAWFAMPRLFDRLLPFTLKRMFKETSLLIQQTAKTRRSPMFPVADGHCDYLYGAVTVRL